MRATAESPSPVHVYTDAEQSTISGTTAHCLLIASFNRTLALPSRRTLFEPIQNVGHLVDGPGDHARANGKQKNVACSPEPRRMANSVC